MKTKKQSHIMPFLAGFVVTLVIVSLTSFAGASDRRGRFALGGALGFMTDTPDSTAFAVGLSGDYYLTNAFSIGPLLQMGFTGDLFMIAPSAQAKYTFDLGGIPNLKPYVQAGIGFIYADLKREGEKDDDTSFIIPFGLGAEYKLTNAISLDGTVLLNATNLDVRDENLFVTVLFGLKFAF
ncbi:MAG: porin family protein [Deltaproteobacteria bacterium]|nr:porin family protein [Deltaproteobacteria bacterium]